MTWLALGLLLVASANSSSSNSSLASWDRRANYIYKIFKQYGGDCKIPIPSSIASVKLPALKALLRVSSEWHLLPASDHYNVFGINIFSRGKFFNKEDIMGDKKLVEEWRDGHATPNAGQEGWVCFAVTSEFDYLFVNVEPTSPYYGQTRHVINNTFEDKPFTSTMEEFFERLEMAAKAWDSLKRYCSADGVDCDDYDVALKNFYESSRDKRADESI